MVRLVVDRPALMKFAHDQGLLRHDDEGHGYVLHAWLLAIFGRVAPKPFRFLENRSEVLGYGMASRGEMLEHARAFASPPAWAVLVPDSLSSKQMPAAWRVGQRLEMEVLVCPITRKDGIEKDVFLRAVDRLGEAVPPRGEVYVDWFRRQWGDAVHFEQIQLAGVSRQRFLRRGRVGGGDARPPRSIERPQALFRAVAEVHDGEAFGRVVGRGIGRHRAFGFGMVLLKPAV
jgi:CRISPR system Cascade subunit CasE